MKGGFALPRCLCGMQFPRYRLRNEEALATRTIHKYPNFKIHAIHEESDQAGSTRNVSASRQQPATQAVAIPRPYSKASAAGCACILAFHTRKKPSEIPSATGSGGVIGAECTETCPSSRHGTEYCMPTIRRAVCKESRIQ
ncbi:hypothetical protein C8Q78DRAFT_1058658 [Trametes maxima]|nr:hypothetical protein C8Q78DRAFT_1058658 [Trametes maxima]